MEEELNEQNEVTQLSDSLNTSSTGYFKTAFNISVFAFLFSFFAEFSEIMELFGEKGPAKARIIGIIPSWLYSVLALAAFAYLLYGLRNHILKYVIPQFAKIMINIMMFAAVVDIVIELIWGLSDDVEMSTIKTYAIIYGLIFAAGGFSLIKVVKNSLAYSFIAYGVSCIALTFYIENAMELASDYKDFILAFLIDMVISVVIYMIVNARIATYLGVNFKKKKDEE